MLSKIHNPGKVNLNDLLKYGNFHNPYLPIERTAIPNISAFNYPVQDRNQIGEEYVLRYMCGRDGPVMNYEKFRVVRWDTEFPNVVILINRYTADIIVSSPEHVLKDESELYDDRGRLISNEFIHQIPIQIADKTDFCINGIFCENEYWDSPDDGSEANEGIVLRCDAPIGHTRTAVIYEPYQMRYILLDETRCMVLEDDLYAEHDSIKAIMNELNL